MSDLKTTLLAIRAEHGTLTPRLVVDTARNPNHDLHRHFTWDDSVAGEQWRRVEARELMRRVRVVYVEADEQTQERTVRGFVAVRNGPTYDWNTTEAIADDPISRAVLLLQMEREWKQLRARYEHFTEFFDLVHGDLEREAVAV